MSIIIIPIFIWLFYPFIFFFWILLVFWVFSYLRFDFMNMFRMYIYVWLLIYTCFSTCWFYLFVVSFYFWMMLSSLADLISLNCCFDLSFAFQAIYINSFFMRSPKTSNPTGFSFCITLGPNSVYLFDSVLCLHFKL